MSKLILKSIEYTTGGAPKAPKNLGVIDLAKPYKKLTITAQNKQVYQLLDEETGEVAKTQKVVRDQKDLKIYVGDVVVVELNDFFSYSGTPENSATQEPLYLVDSTDAACVRGLISSSTTGMQQPEMSVLWEPGTTLASCLNPSAIAPLAGIAGIGGLTTAGAAGMTTAVGLAAVQASQSVDAAGVVTKLYGNILAGPVVAQLQAGANVSGLKVAAFDEKGNNIGTANVKADGSYTLELKVKDYKGALLLKVYDDTTDNLTAQYRDEATGSAKAFSTIMAVVNLTGKSDDKGIVVNITPLTHMAAIKAGAVDSTTTPTVPSATKIDSANNDIGQKFLGTTDLLSANAVATINADGSSNSTKANTYGAALNLISQYEKNTGQSTTATVNDLISLINGKDTNNAIANKVNLAAADALKSGVNTTDINTFAKAYGNQLATGTVEVSSSSSSAPKQGDTLTLTVKDFVDANNTSTTGGAFKTAPTYQWQSFDGSTWSDISGATQTTFTLTQAQVGKQVRAIAKNTDDSSFSEFLTSTATAKVANVNDPTTGTVAITGTPTQNSQLTLTNTLADADGLGTLSYQWQSSSNGSTWTDIGSATGLNYTPNQADVGKLLRVAVSYTDLQGTAEQYFSAPTSSPVTNVNDAPTGSVSITNSTSSTRGTASLQQNDVLTAANTLADADGLGTITYTWKAGGSPVGTGTSYTLTAGDVGKAITVEASYIDGQGANESVSSSATANVAVLPPVSATDQAGSVAITGTATQGQTLTASAVTDADGGVTGTTYQWKAGSTNVGTGTSYTLTQADVGKAITVVATYTDSLGSGKTATSSPTANVMSATDQAGSVAITGTATQGQTLTASAVTDADGGVTGTTYQWKAGSTNVGTGTSYTLTQADVGKAITVVATYTDSLGSGKTATSSPTANVMSATDQAGSVAITGTATQGQTLTASAVTDADGGVTGTTYQWKAGSTNVGTGGTTYTLTAADIGKAITVTASYTDAQGPNKTVTSAATSSVAAATDRAGSITAITNTTSSTRGIANLQQNDTLTAGTVTDPDGTVSAVTYQWKAGTTNIAGATNSTYTLTQAEVGKIISVVATYTDPLGSGKTATSTGTGNVINVNDAPTGTVSITNSSSATRGTASLQQDDVLTAANTLADPDGLGPITYTWKAGTSTVGTGASYTLKAADVGQAITVEASYTDGQSTNERVPSAATSSVIANTNIAPALSLFNAAKNDIVPGAFTVNGGVGTSTTIPSVVINGNKVELTLAAGVAPTTLSYTNPGGSLYPIQDTTGNDAANLGTAAAPITISNYTVVPADALAPSLISAKLSADRTKVLLTYSESLDTTQPLVTGTFTVTAGANTSTFTNKGISTAAVSATDPNTVELTLSAALAVTDTFVTVTSNPGTANATLTNAVIQDPTGNDAPAFNRMLVGTTNYDSVAPVLRSVTTTSVGGVNKIIMTYSEALNTFANFTEGYGSAARGALTDIFGIQTISAGEASQTITGVSFTISGLKDGAYEKITVNGTDITLGSDSTGTATRSVSGATISVNYTVTLSADKTSATLALTNSTGVSTAVAESFIRNMTYENLNLDNPTPGVRVFDVSSITDSSGAGNATASFAAGTYSSSVLVTALNDAPTIANSAVLANLNTTNSQAPGSALSIPLTSVRVADPDANSTIEYLKFQFKETPASGSATYPPLMLNFPNKPNSSLSILGKTSGNIYTVGGTVSDLNEWLAMSNAITYIPTSTFIGTTTAISFRIQDSFGQFNDLAANPVSITVAADTRAPAFKTAVASSENSVANGYKIILSYDEPLTTGVSNANLPPASAFAVSGLSVTGVAEVGSNVILTVSGAVTAGTTVKYTDPGAGVATAIMDAAGNHAATQAAAVTVDTTDSTAPILASSPVFYNGAGDGVNKYLIYFNEELSSNKALTNFSISVVDPTNPSNTGTPRITVVDSGGSNSYSENAVMVSSLQGALSPTASIQLTYTDPTTGNDTTALQDLAGNDVPNMVLGMWTNDSLTANQGSFTANKTVLVVGGQGNDTMTGGNANDTFTWFAGDAGTTTGAVDIVKSFSAWNGSSGDKIDISKLLTNGYNSVSSTLSQWVTSVTNNASGAPSGVSATNTKIVIDIDGQPASGAAAAGSPGTGTVTQTIWLDGVNLPAGANLDAQLTALKNAGILIA